MAVYSAMAIVGIPVGLLAGGLLVTYASWRWVFFVNVPIGLVVAVLATRVLPQSGRRAGRFDLPGAITATAGVALLVYGLSNAATTPDGVSHWGDAKVVVSLAAAAVLLAAFAVIETRSSGSIGLAVVGTVAWSAVASSLRAAAAAAAKAGGHPPGAQAALLQTRIYHRALATGFSRGYLVSAGILALILIIALFMMRVRREDLSGADPAPEPAGDTSSPRLA